MNDAFRLGIDDQADIGVVVDIDEPRRDSQVFGADDDLSSAIFYFPYGYDQIIGNTDIRLERRTTQPVEDKSVFYEEVIFLSCSAALKERAAAAQPSDGSCLGCLFKECPTVHFFLHAQTSFQGSSSPFYFSEPDRKSQGLPVRGKLKTKAHALFRLWMVQTRDFLGHKIAYG
jgi:hypothetical protein